MPPHARQCYAVLVRRPDGRVEKVLQSPRRRIAVTHLQRCGGDGAVVRRADASVVRATPGLLADYRMEIVTHALERTAAGGISLCPIVARCAPARVVSRIRLGVADPFAYPAERVPLVPLVLPRPPGSDRPEASQSERVEGKPAAPSVAGIVLAGALALGRNAFERLAAASERARQRVFGRESGQ